MTRALDVERGVRIRTADGIDLLTDVYRPHGSGRLPTVLIRSPYGRGKLWATMAELFAERGYHAVLQSCRGTFGSGGRLDFHQEGADGRVTADWIVEQPWSNGVIGTAGPSYLSLVQWALASTRPPQLKAMAIHIMASDRRRSMYPGGSFALDTALTWSYQVSMQERPFLPWLVSFVRTRRALEPAFRHLPLIEADVVGVGREVQMYRDWLTHDQPGDSYWATIDFSQIITALGIPVSFVGAWYDYYLPYLLDDHAALVKSGADVQLSVVPGPHTDFQGLASGVRQAFDWLDAHLLGDRSRLDASPVRVIMGGGAGLRRLVTWPPEFVATRLYLGSGGRLGDAPPVDSKPDKYRYDPADPTPAVGGTTISSNSGAKDNRTLEARADVLTYTGEPLTQALEIMGPVAAEIFVSSSLEHADFFARLCDVAPDGRSTNVCDGLIRLRPGEPPRDVAGVACVRIELWPTAYQFAAGHRLRLQVSSGAHPRYARNLGGGEPLATATSLVAADQAVFHDPAHPSVLVLPVIPTGLGGEGPA